MPYINISFCLLVATPSLLLLFFVATSYGDVGVDILLVKLQVGARATRMAGGNSSKRSVKVASNKKSTVYWEIFAVKKFSRLSVTAKITRAKFFQQRNTVTIFLIQEVDCYPQYHPKQLLQQIEKW